MEVLYSYWVDSAAKHFDYSKKKEGVHEKTYSSMGRVSVVSVPIQIERGQLQQWSPLC